MTGEFESLLKGMDTLVRTKTVVGDPMKIDDATIVPIMEVSFGMASGAFNQGGSSAGAMSARMTPVALFVMQHDTCRMIQIKNTDAISKAIDMIPDFINRISGKGISRDIEKKAEKTAMESRPSNEML